VELKRWPEAPATPPDAEMAMAGVAVAPQTQAQEAPARVASPTDARQAVSSPDGSVRGGSTGG
jgi:hypothetical protein